MTLLATLGGKKLSIGSGVAAQVDLPRLPHGRTAYYVAPDGSDTNPGTIAAPWATIDKAMSHAYTAGDQLLFQRGGTYYGLISTTPAVSAAERLYVGAYGVGDAPLITNSYVFDNPASWILSNTNVWRIDLSTPSTHGGWQGIPDGGGQGGNIGFLADGDTYYVAKKTSLGALAAQWDFFCDSTYLYVYSVGNPHILAPDLIGAPDGILIKAASHTQITGLELAYCGGHAIRNNLGENGQPTDTNVVITHNHIHHIGGSFLIGYADNTTRYGNGCECNTRAQNWLVAGNEVHDCYDVALTAQGGAGCDFENLRWTGNHCHHNMNHDEWSADGAGVGFINCLFDNNDLEDGGAGIFVAVHPNPEYRVCHIRFNLTASNHDLKVTGNRIKRVAGAYCYHAVGGNGAVVATYSSNDIQLAAGTLMQYGNTATIGTAAAWAAAKGTEAGSTFTVL